MFKSLLPFVLAALVLESGARPVHPPSDVPTGMIPRSSNSTSTPLDLVKAVAPLPLLPRKATSHGAAPAPVAPLALVPRQEEEEEAESEARRPSHRKPKPSNDDNKPLGGSIHLGSRADKNNTSSPLPIHVPRSQNSTNSTTTPIKLPRSNNSTMTPIKLPRSTNNSTSPLPVHVVPRDEHNSTTTPTTMPVNAPAPGERNATMPIHVPRASTHSPAEHILHELPQQPRPRTTVEAHVPAEKVTDNLPVHHPRAKQEDGDAPAPAPARDNVPIVIPRHSTGVAPVDEVAHSAAHMLRQEMDEARSEC